MKKKWIWLGSIIIILIFLVYLIVGAIAPFMKYKEVRDPSQYQERALQIMEGKESVDRAGLLETNISAWEERIRLLSAAQERIIISTFDMRDGESTRDILAVLQEKAESGVKIQILVDGVSGSLRLERNSLFHAVSSHPNIEIRIYNPIDLLKPWKSQGRMHDKYVIVDDFAYLLGGRNMFDYFIGDYPTKNRSYDREVLIYNSAHGTEKSKESSLHEVEAYFNRIWEQKDCKIFHNDEKERNKKSVIEQIEVLKDRYKKILEQNPELFEKQEYESRTYETNGVYLIANPTGLYGKEPIVFYQLKELMKLAREQVILHTPYAVLNEDMVNGLKEVTSKVSTRMMINAAENGDNVMATSDYLRNKDKVLETGMKILEYDGGISYHGKSLAIDHMISIIGSYNLDLRSTYVDTELMLAVHSEGLTEELLENMQMLESDCKIVTGIDTYEIPNGFNASEVSWIKRVIWWLIGLVMQPFRYLV